MTSQALIPINNPAELILAEIEAKCERFKQERGEHLTAIEQLKQQLNHLENQIKQKDQKEGRWLNLLQTYWSNEVDIFNLAQSLQTSSLPSEKAKIIERMKQLNKPNIKVEKDFKKKSWWGWISKLLFWLVVIGLVVGGAVLLWRYRPWKWTEK